MARSILRAWLIATVFVIGMLFWTGEWRLALFTIGCVFGGYGVGLRAGRRI